MHDPKTEAERWLLSGREDFDYAHHAASDALLDAARELDLFYIPTRYPNGLESGTPGQAFSAAQSKRALDLASPFVASAAKAVGHD